jgi:magnesium transporter
MVNTLFLPELREMLADGNASGLAEFCTALNPARTADYMEGLTADEAWQVLQHAEAPWRAEIFSYFEWDRQLELLRSQDSAQLADLMAQLAADDRVDLLQELDDQQRVDEVLAYLSVADRRDTLRLQSYPEGTAGALMTTEIAMLPERLTVRGALEELSRQAEELETIYYLYVVDDEQRLRGVVSTRQLVSALAKPDLRLGDLMETDAIVAEVDEDQETVADKVARYNLLAIPVVDSSRKLLGIITHDDVMDVMVQEMTEDFQRISAVSPLEEGYLETNLLTLSWKRGTWLVVLFFGALLTAFALKSYGGELQHFAWLGWFIPLIISTGGNSGSQSATLIITALSTGDVKLTDWIRVIFREWLMGLMLGGGLAMVGMGIAILLAPSPHDALVIPITILLVVACGTLVGATLPLIFKRLGLDPAIMSNPFVSGIIDIVGILIYINVARLILS